LIINRIRRALGIDTALVYLDESTTEAFRQLTAAVEALGLQVRGAGAAVAELAKTWAEPFGGER